MDEEGREYPVGQNHHRSKLTEDDVRNIRALHDIAEEHRRQANNLSIRAIADKFGVSEKTIWQIVAGKTWTHVK